MPDLIRKQFVQTSRTFHAKKKAMDGFGVKVHEQTTHPKAGIDKRLLEGKEEEERKRRLEERKERRKEGMDVGNAEQILSQKRT